VDSSTLATDDTGKRRGTSEEPHIADIQQPRDTYETTGKRKVVTATSGPPKRQQNNMLLFNAMRTTASHTNVAFSAGALALGESLEGIAAAAPPVGQGARSSATPAPVAPQELPPKAPPPVKKKRKRE